MDMAEKKEKEKEKLLVIDGNSLTHRAFHALPLLSNQQGVFTNAVYGFTTMLHKALRLLAPDYLIVVFDKGKVTFRHQDYADYKVHRKPTPSELRPQFALIKKVLRAMRIAVFEMEDYEADDLIGTIVKKASQAGLDSVILTSDRDVLQLISSNTKVWLSRKGISEFAVFDKDTVMERYGIAPCQLVDVKALMGDSSDNIPGVPGVGEKTALKLIREFKDLDSVYSNINDNSSLAEKLRENEEQARLSRRLALIACDVPLEIDWEECRCRQPDFKKLLDIYRELEFKSLVKELLSQMKETPQNRAISTENVDCRLLAGEENWDCFYSAVKETGVLALYPLLEEGNCRRAKILGLGCSCEKGKAWALEINNENGVSGLKKIRNILEDKTVKLYSHDFKPFLLALQRDGIEPACLAGDTLLAAYLLNPSQGERDLSQLWLDYKEEAMIEEEAPVLDAGYKAEKILVLIEMLHEKLQELSMQSLYFDLELPLVFILSGMEKRGIKLDLKQLEALDEEFSSRIEVLTSEIYDLAGEEFNINSPKQLGEILFNNLKLPVVKKTKTGFSTSAEVLSELSALHPLPALVLEYRQLVKLKTTYVDGLKRIRDPETGRVHTTFKQTVTATGRLSSVDPNLQNIPVRLELGRRLRKAFVPSEGKELLAADYSQIELRILAHISGDTGFIEAFRRGDDIHSITAAEVFQVPYESVTSEMRRRAKAVNFGIVYGISDFGLARDLSISRQQAKEYIETYFKRYPRIKEYMEETIAEAREKGYVTTLLRRRRYLPDIFSPNRNVRASGERTAVNTPIQGSAADIIKLAMLKVEKQLREEKLSAFMLLQVHDELIFEVDRLQLPRAAAVIKKAMEGVFPLKVPLVVDLKSGPNWYDLTSYN